MQQITGGSEYRSLVVHLSTGSRSVDKSRPYRWGRASLPPQTLKRRSVSSVSGSILLWRCHRGISPMGTQEAGPVGPSLHRVVILQRNAARCWCHCNGCAAMIRRRRRRRRWCWRRRWGWDRERFKTEVTLRHVTGFVALGIRGKCACRLTYFCPAWSRRLPVLAFVTIRTNITLSS